ncbi:MAG TPA: hypothetical protein VKV77_06955 [Methylovirgula sp.]|nr:hypothetical protein [Methylovirgula sp.]
MNDTPELDPELLVFAAICSEAARRHGDDWRAVQRHIRKCVHALPLDQRERLASEMDRVLRYRAPDGGTRTQ